LRKWQDGTNQKVADESDSSQANQTVIDSVQSPQANVDSVLSTTTGTGVIDPSSQLPPEFDPSGSTLEGLRVLQCIEWLRDRILEGSLGHEDAEMVT
jgi:hypothetical protein